MDTLRRSLTVWANPSIPNVIATANASIANATDIIMITTKYSFNDSHPNFSFLLSLHLIEMITNI